MAAEQSALHIFDGHGFDQSSLVGRSPWAMTLPDRQRPFEAPTTSNASKWPTQAPMFVPLLQPNVTDLSASKAALQNHLAKLTDKECELFLSLSQMDITEYVVKIEQAAKEQKLASKAVQIAQKLEPLVRTVKMYAPIAHTVLQADPSPSMFVLGGVTCVLSIPSRFLIHQLHIIDGLSAMGNMMSLLTKYDTEVYSNDDNIQSILTTLIGDVLDFCREASKLVLDEDGSRRRTWKILGRSFWEPWEARMGAIEERFQKNFQYFERSAGLVDRRIEKEHRALHMGMMMHQDHINENLMGSLFSIHQTMLADFNRNQFVELQRLQEETRKKVLDWIPYIPFDVDHRNKVSECLPGTGQWLLKDKRLLGWKSDSNPKSGALLVQGKSGCGKSCLAAVVVEKLVKESDSSDEKTAVAYVYCNNLEDAKIDPYKLKGSLLRQLYLQTPTDSSIPAIESMCNNTQSESASPEQLEKAISTVSTCFKQSYIVVDGLDECHRLKNDLFENFCAFLRSLAESAPSVLKVLIFSRPRYVEVEQAFGSYPSVMVDSGANTEDIKQFINSRVSGGMLHIRDMPDLLKYVEKELFLRADGMFLWVGLQVQSLKAVRNTEDVEDMLASLPLTLDEFYAEDLLRIIGLRPKFRRERALKILLWVANARRPLSRSEITEALAIKSDLSDLDQGRLIAGDDGITAECGDLIVLRDGRYQLVHTSLQDYLSGLLESEPEHLKLFWSLQAKANEILGEACLTYLQFNKFKTGPLSDLKTFKEFQEENPFYGYAASYWGCHVLAAPEDQFRDKIVALISCDESRELFIQHFRVFNDYPEKSFPYPGSSTPLHALAIFNLVKTAASIEGTSEQRRKCDGFGYLPLDFTFVQKNRDMCMWLLQDQEEFVMEGMLKDGRYAPLHMVAQYDWGDQLEKLASIGCDLERKVGDKQQTALHVAALHDCKHAMTALLNMKVCVDPIDVINYTPLHYAAEHNHLALLSLLLNAGTNANHKARQDITALHLVAINGNTEAAKDLIKFGAELEPLAGEHKTLTPLHLAAEYNHSDIIKLLVSRGANIESESLHKVTPLLLACSSGSLISFNTLLSLGASIEARREDNGSALHLAANNGDLELVGAIHKENAKLVEVTDNEGDTPVHTAIKFKQPHIAIALLKFGAPVEKVNYAGSTPLHLAVIWGYVDLVQALVIDYKANQYSKTASKASLLHLACREGDFLMVKTLVQLSQNLEFALQDDHGNTPLHYAIKSGSVDIANFLLGHGVSAMSEAIENTPALLTDGSHESFQETKTMSARDGINSRCTLGRTALFNAAVNGHLDLVRILLNAGADPDIPDKDDESPLLIALSYQRSHVAEALLANGANPKVVDKYGRTPLFEATRTGNYKLTKKLLEADCDGLYSTAQGFTPFSVAVSTHKVEFIDLFMRHGFNGANSSTKYGFTPYHSAALDGDIDLLEKLIEIGQASAADLGSLDYLGNNAIHFAAIGGHVEVVDRLVQLGVEVNPIHGLTRPTICEAARVGCIDMTSRLLEHGADLETIDGEEGMTPLITAAAFNNPKTFRHLFSLGASSIPKDVYGRSALDYAFQISELREALGDEAQQKCKLDESARKIKLRKTTRERLSSLSSFPIEPTPAVQVQRNMWMRTLAYALLALNDDPNHESTITCLTELGNLPKDSAFAAEWRCNICRRDIADESQYVCTQCYDVDLCNACHSDYVRGADAPRQAPQKLKTLEQLEKDLEPFRTISFLYSDVLEGHLLVYALDGSFLVAEWLDKRIEVLNDWEKTFNSKQEFNTKTFPGATFLKSIDNCRKVTKKQDEKTHEMDQSEKDGDAAEPEKQIDGIVTQTTESDPHDDDPFFEVDESLRQLFRDYRPNKEGTTFHCSGHEYIEIPNKIWSEYDTNDGPFDSQGRVTKEWFLELLTRYSTDASDIVVSQESDSMISEMAEQDSLMRLKMETDEVTSAPGSDALESVPSTDALESVPSIDPVESIPDTDPPDSVHSADPVESTLGTKPVATVNEPSPDDQSEVLGPQEDVKSIADSQPVEVVNGLRGNDPIDVPGAEEDEELDAFSLAASLILRLKSEIICALAELVRHLNNSAKDGGIERANFRRPTLNLIAVDFLVMEATFQFAQVVLFGRVITRLLREKELEKDLISEKLLEEADIAEFNLEISEGKGQRGLEELSYLKVFHVLRLLQRIPASIDVTESLAAPGSDAEAPREPSLSLEPRSDNGAERSGEPPVPLEPVIRNNGPQNKQAVECQ